jgi:hypothetical protein
MEKREGGPGAVGGGDSSAAGISPQPAGVDGGAVARQGRAAGRE